MKKIDTWLGIQKYMSEASTVTIAPREEMEIVARVDRVQRRKKRSQRRLFKINRFN